MIWHIAIYVNGGKEWGEQERERYNPPPLHLDTIDIKGEGEAGGAVGWERAKSLRSYPRYIQHSELSLPTDRFFTAAVPAKFTTVFYQIIIFD